MKKMKNKKTILIDAVKMTILIVSIIGTIIIITGLESILETMGIPGIVTSCLIMVFLLFIVSWIYETKPDGFKRVKR